MELRNPPGIPERHRGHSQLIHEIEVPLTDEDLGAMTCCAKMCDYWEANKCHRSMANCMTSPLEMAVSESMYAQFERDFAQDEPNMTPSTRRQVAQLSYNRFIRKLAAAPDTTNVPGNCVPSSRVNVRSDIDPTNQGDGSHSVPMERDDLGSLTCSQTLVKRKQDPTNQGDGSHSVTTNVDFTEPQLALVKRHRALQVGLSRPLPVDCCDLPGCTCKSTRAGNPISGLLLSGDNIPGHYKAPLVCTELPDDLDDMLERDGHVALRMPKRVFQLRGHIACNVSHPQPNG